MSLYTFVDTHAHLDGEEFSQDRDEVVKRAQEAGASAVLVPAINAASEESVAKVCQAYPGFLWPMMGLHPEEVGPDYQEVLSHMRSLLPGPYIAIGEVGLDFYWSREYMREQLDAFEQQVAWSVETQLPLMIHSRKAQHELVAILRRYRDRLPGGVFHCFTGNSIEAAELLQFEGFVLGIGGVLTFKKSRLPEVVAEIPLSRIVLETDAPYMAPVPMRGKRNESAFVPLIIEKMAQCKGITPDEVARVTTENVYRIFKRMKCENC